MFLKFEEWLISQQTREDLIGDLARVLSKQNADNKSSRGRFDEHKRWVDIVIGISEPGYIPVFNDAWQEFVLAKQAAEEPLDEVEVPKERPYRCQPASAAPCPSRSPPTGGAKNRLTSR